MENKIEIGAVAKPQGIKGELKIRLFADGFDSVKGVTEVEINSVVYSVESFRYAGGEEAILKIKGVDDRNFAETLRRYEVYAKREQIKLEEGRFFITDVIGCDLYLDSGKKIGIIKDIISGNVDYYYLDTNEGEAVFPLLADLLISIDIENKKVTVKAKRFTEVVMYEN
ncbi:MAG: 16S rRNA processing protein RimM [Clostridiales bacterium]|nr:16S rRNA processing protein RimM [Clostridiales bacterium]